MTTFSQMVDELTLELVRPDLRDTICSYLNQTLREVHFDEKTEMPVFYGDNRFEAEAYFNTNPVVWPIPFVSRFQALDVIYLPWCGEYAVQRTLRRIHDSEDRTRFYWYRTGPAIAIGGIGQVIPSAQIAWFEFVRNLAFFPAGTRPATFKRDSGEWEFHNVGGTDYGSTPSLREQALEMSTNWLLERWSEIIKAGVRNKVYIRLGEQERARTTYPIYSTGRKQIINTESLNTESHLS